MKRSSSKKQQKKNRIWSQFFMSVSISIVLFTLGIFIGLLLRNNHLINNEIRTRAKAHVHNIMMTRKWNAHYGGVYVEKKEGIESNPYLDDPDIETIDGRKFTLKNPALMTREISELFEKDGLLTFNMTSLKPINPRNEPDEFEKYALGLFEEGKGEVYKKERSGDETTLRYMVPLFVTKDCLKCHARQGYEVGNIRGGISVEFDISKVEASLMQNKYIILSLGTISAFTLLGIIYSFTFVLRRKLENAHKKIKELVITDELTNLYNRRYFFNKLGYEVKRSIRFKQDLACIILDIDLFKDVNDRYGHVAGDQVLKKTACAVRSCCRTIDTVARYGGEEFIILLPGTDIEGALNLAEKIRVTVEKLDVEYEKDIVITVTVSLGVSAFNGAELKKITDNDEIIKQADDALYKAKQNGRNRVEKA